MEKIYQYLPQEFVTFVLVTLFSLLIGLSQRRISLKREGETTLFGTDRTFTFIGILGYLLYILDPREFRLFLGGGAVLGVLLALNYYVKQTRHHVFGVTTIVIALITYCLAPIVITQPSWFYVMVVVVVLLLTELKHTFTELAQRMKNDEMIILAKFLAISGIILPMVLARKSREASAGEAPEYAAAMLMAISMMFLRFLILTGIFSREVLAVVYPYLLLMSAVSALVAWWLHRRRGAQVGSTADETDTGNPLEFKVALIFALLFVVFTLLTHYTLLYAGTGGLTVLSFLSGVSDITPFILNLLQGTGNVDVPLVAACSLQAIVSNIAVNLAYALFFAGRRNALSRWAWRGFGVVIGANVVLLAVFYLL